LQGKIRRVNLRAVSAPADAGDAAIKKSQHVLAGVGGRPDFDFGDIDKLTLAGLFAASSAARMPVAALNPAS